MKCYILEHLTANILMIIKYFDINKNVLFPVAGYLPVTISVFIRYLL